MKIMNNQDGHCLCGKVKFTAKDRGNKVTACHCGMCRRWGGGPFIEVECRAEVRFKGEDNISVYDSSEWAERGFCKHCGTHLFYHLKGTQEYQMPVGLFENQQNLVFKEQVFIDEKPDYYSFSNKTSDLTGAEVYAMYVDAPG